MVSSPVPGKIPNDASPRDAPTNAPSSGFSDFSEAERRGVYRAIYERRDVRSHFLPDAVPDEVLHRILDAAHHAPSVGFMQPWDFIVIRDASVRQAMHRNFETASRRAAERYQG